MASEELLYKLHYVPKPGWHSSLLHVTDRQIVLLFLVPALEGYEIHCQIWDLFSGAPVGEFSRYGLSNVKMHGFAGYLYIALFNRQGNVVLEAVNLSVDLEDGYDSGQT